MVAKACSVLRAVAAAQLFDHFQREQAEEAAQRLVALVFRKQEEGGASASTASVASEVISALGQALPKGRPTLQLVVQATVVRDVNVGEEGGSSRIWEAGAPEDQMLGSSNDSEDSDEDCGPQPSCNEENNPLASIGDDPQAMGDQLLQLLGAREALRPLLRKATVQLGPDAAWRLFLNVQQCIARHQQEQQSQLASANGHGATSMTAGPLFLKMARESSGTHAAKSGQPEEVQPAPFVLRDYQQRAVNMVLHGGGNWVVAAPTNSGKTAIFIELSRHLLLRNPKAKIVVLAPAVSLVRQHCNAYTATGSFRAAMGEPKANQAIDVPVVDWFCGDKPLIQGTWSAELSRLGVVVLEARSFLNLLDEDQAQLEDVDMLVLDECHHTDKLHPYAVVMSYYNALTPENRPQVLGFSASPASGTTEDRVMHQLSRLLRSLHAHLHVISEEDVAHQQVVSSALEGEEYVPARQQDYNMASWIRSCISTMASNIGYSLQSFAPSQPEPHLLNSSVQGSKSSPNPDSGAVAAAIGNTAARARTPAGALQTLAEGLRMVEGMRAHQPSVHVLNLLCGWISKAMDVARIWSLKELAGCLQFLEVLRRTAALSEDMGYECGLQYAAQHIVDMAMAHTAWADQQQGQMGNQQQQQQQKPTNVLHLCRMFLEQLEVWAATLGFGSTAEGRNGVAGTALCTVACVGATKASACSDAAQQGSRGQAVIGQLQGQSGLPVVLADDPCGPLKRRRLDSLGHSTVDSQAQPGPRQQDAQHRQHPQTTYQQRGVQSGQAEHRSSCQLQGRRHSAAGVHGEGVHGNGSTSGKRGREDCGVDGNIATLSPHPPPPPPPYGAQPRPAPPTTEHALSARPLAPPPDHASQPASCVSIPSAASTASASTGAAAAAGLVHCVLAPVLPAALEPAPAAHPKLWALVQYLLQYQDREAFHGIVFSRACVLACTHLAEVLRMAMSSPASPAALKAMGQDPDSPTADHAKGGSGKQHSCLGSPTCLSPRAKGGTSPASTAPCPSPRGRANGGVAPPLLGFIQDVHVFVGHGSPGQDKSRLAIPTEGAGGGVGSGAAAGAAGAGADWATASGMTIYQQQAVLDAFKAPGRRILVATNAAEEGLDVPCCEFVVRFSPPATGVQRVQARGRSRKLGAQYMCLIQMHAGVQHGGSDAALQGKSDAEEAALRRVLSKVAQNKHTAT
ncbi:hypothetical protein DUNSADRAFT_5829 [Dunaliella salina]|uniref:Uncharacterized protein n=1 Tax=Dunaliella salina TaxID=3046 RepID=A0ABQ7GPQ7_DUNSA|nr:hypothetical protein DUNSADRAFT_5829 [Dunaliella salina]|eukprot:KAF5836541.1 hypothetical protein DUNSADRAFT_5829 [Dunaliella salina]